MKKVIFLVISVLALLSMIVVSCIKDGNFTGDQSGITYRSDTSAEEVYTIRKLFAQTLLKAMSQEPELRTYIYTKCRIADTSNYELIYLTMKDDVISNARTFGNILQNYAAADVLRLYGTDFFETLINKTPLLTISFPDLDNIRLSDWSPNSTPNVVAVSTIDLKSFTLFERNSNTANEYTLRDNQREEDIINTPVLVIYDSEIHYLVREDGVTFDGVDIGKYMPSGPPIDLRGDPIEPPFDCWYYFVGAQAAYQVYIITGIRYYLVLHDDLLEAYYDCLDRGDNNGDDDPPCDEPCERDCEQNDEHVVRFKINGWNVWDKIHNQPFEKKYIFQGHVLGIAINSLGTPYTIDYPFSTGTYKKSDILDCSNHSSHPCIGIWKAINYRWWTDWKEDIVASPYQVTWAEVDTGKKTLSSNLGLSVSYKVDTNITKTLSSTIGYSYTGAEIVELGTAPVFYCDPIMMENNTLSITFKCD